MQSPLIMTSQHGVNLHNFITFIFFFKVDILFNFRNIAVQ